MTKKPLIILLFTLISFSSLFSREELRFQPIKSSNKLSQRPVNYLLQDNICLPQIWTTKPAYIVYFSLAVILAFLTFKITNRITKLENNLAIEKKAIESQLKFFTNVSHEFRTPLTLILGPIESIILRNDIPKDVRDQLKLVHRNTKRLLRLINQLLDFRKVQNENVSINIQEIRLIPFLREVYSCYLGAAKQKNITFNLSFDNANLKVWGDFQKLDIVFFNLLSNAFKFTPENKSISINVKSDENNKQVIITFADTGIGIQPDKLPFIFERFFVSHINTDDKYTGTGIGLSLAMEYMRLHHGKIDVKSTVGEGTSFILYLPTNQQQFIKELFANKEVSVQNNFSAKYQDEIIEKEESGLPKKTTQERSTVLIVEDDVDMSQYIASLLSYGFSVKMAKDGIEGWEKALKWVPDLIITDVMMPRMDGIEFTKKLKEDYNTCHIPVIILTSKSEINDQIMSINTGAEWYMSKPFNEKILNSYVNTIILQREKIRQKFDNVVRLKPDEINVTAKDKVFLDRVIKLIEENIPDFEFSVEKLSGQFEFSRTVFYKKLKAISGYQPVEFIKLLRLKRAAQLLLTKQYNVSEVAFMTGFNDIKYFSTCFKKQFNSLPSKYIDISISR
jgi:signal transduction histidine kinase/CheY-like chemotaxis protein